MSSQAASAAFNVKTNGFPMAAHSTVKAPSVAIDGAELGKLPEVSTFSEENESVSVVATAPIASTTTSSKTEPSGKL